jgi:hypothetical protein
MKALPSPSSHENTPPGYFRGNFHFSAALKPLWRNSEKVGDRAPVRDDGGADVVSGLWEKSAINHNPTPSYRRAGRALHDLAAPDRQRRQRLLARPLNLATPGPRLVAPRFDKLLETLQVVRDAA